mgnify:CR=1 FL=1
MENRICSSTLVSLLVGGLSVAMVVGLIRTSPTFAAAAPAAPAAASAENTAEQIPKDILKQAELEGVWRVLVVFLILSAVIESALTPLFNWRLFVRHFLNKGLRIPITVLFAILVVRGYDLDIFRDILVALGESAEPRIGGQVLTAFLLAGGSSGVNKLLQTWKIRLSDGERSERANEAKPQVEETPLPNRSAQEKVR